MLVTLPGIITLVRPVSKNAKTPMIVTLLGITIFGQARAEFERLDPMLVTLPGMVTLDSGLMLGSLGSSALRQHIP